MPLRAALIAEGNGDRGLVGVLEKLCWRAEPQVEIDLEIATAVAEVASLRAWVPVVPIHESEAWLLTSEDEIRSVVGNPRGRELLGLLKLGAIETTKQPKERLKEALRLAMKRSPSRLEDSQFGSFRTLLFESLDIDGPVTQLGAWQRLLTDIDAAIARLQGTNTN